MSKNNAMSHASYWIWKAALLAVSVTAQAAITGLTVTGTTATQAVIVYTAPSTDACTLKVSQVNDFSGTYAPIHDVNAALFTGANSDARTSSVNSGVRRMVVVGKRVAEWSSDGVAKYSRALQANTQHYFQITCGVDTTTGQFTTTNVPIGYTVNDPFPGDAAFPGEALWPTLDVTPRWTHAGNVPTQRIIDPNTGLLAIPATPPESSNTYTPVVPVSATDMGGPGLWNNPSYILTSDANSATYTGSGQAGGENWLEVNYETSKNPTLAGAGASAHGLDNLEIQMQSACTSGNCATASTNDRTVEICLDVLRTGGCGSKLVELVVPVASVPSNSTYTLAPATRNGGMGDWTVTGRVRTLDYYDLATRSTSVTISGTTATRTSGNYFNPSWVNGTKVLIGGTQYRVSRVVNPTALILQSGPADGAYTLKLQTKVLVRKKTSSTHTLAITYIRLAPRETSIYYWDTSGNSEDCSRVQTSDGGYHCAISGVLYWVNALTGEARLLSRMSVPSTANYNLTDCGSWHQGAGPAIWSTVDANAWYCLAVDKNTANHVRVVKGSYIGGTPHPANSQQNWDGTTGADPALIAYTDEGVDVTQQLIAFAALDGKTFDPAFFTNCGVGRGTYSSHLLLSCQAGSYANSQDRLGWLFVYDYAAHQVIAATDTWTGKWPKRWGTSHSSDLNSAGTWVGGGGEDFTGAGCGGVLGAANTNTGCGPYKAKLLTDVALCTIGSSCDVCPGPPSNLTYVYNWPTDLRKCSTIGVDGEPCDLDPSAQETTRNSGKCGDSTTAFYLQDAQPGDTFQAYNSTAGQWEFMRLLARAGLSWTVERKLGTATDHPMLTHLAGDYLLAMPDAANVNDSNSAGNHSGQWYWNYAADPHGVNTSGNTVIVDSRAVTGTRAVNGGWALTADPKEGGVYRVRKGSTPADLFPTSNPMYAVSSNAPFAVPATDMTTASLSHVGITQLSAPEREKRWALDARPFGEDSPTNFGTSATLVPGMTTVYRLVLGAGMNRKLFPTFAASGRHPLLDISGPGSVIDDTKPYTYCVALLANECVSGSTPGALYVSSPHVTDISCVALLDTERNDLCVGDARPYLANVSQIGVENADRSGRRARTISKVFTWPRLQSGWTAKSLPNANWLYSLNLNAEMERNMLFLFKNPGWPAFDSTNRSTFQPHTVQIGQLPAVITGVYAEFGYTPTFACASRAEACIANSATIDQTTNPFYWASETWSPLSCGTGCTLKIPALPQRILYYRLKFTDVNGIVITTGETQIAAIP